MHFELSSSHVHRSLAARHSATVATASAPRAPMRLAVLLASLALGACASLARPTPGELPAGTLPAAWSSAAPAGAASAPSASLAEWWRRFDDPLLSALITRALAHNTDVLSAQASLREARALRDVSAAGLQPTLGVSASAQRSRSGGSASSNLYQAGFDAGWEPDLFGGKRAGVDAAGADADASAATLGNVQVSIAAELAVAYVGLRGNQARAAIARENLASQEETLQIARWRNQAGLATSLEVEQARAATEQTRAQLPALDASIAQGAHSIAVLTGQAPGALLAQLQPAAAVPRAPDGLALAFPAETLRQRPDVRAAERQVGAAAARVTQADAARLPSFQLSGSLGLSALALGSLTGGGAVVSALLGSVSMPILDGGANRAQLRAQQAAFDRAGVQYQAVVLAALQEVEDALVALQSGRERLATLRQAADAAGNAALLARQRYSSGLIDFQTVLETQRTLLSTQDAVAGAEAELGANHVRLYKALGGGWQPADASATAAAVPAAARSSTSSPSPLAPSPAATPRS